MFAPKQLYNIKKVRVWRVQKCIFLIGAKTSFTCVGLQTSLSQVSQYKAEKVNLRKSESTPSHGTVFASKQCSYQKETTGIETPKMYSSSWCKNLSYLYRTANNPSQVSQYRADNGNLRKSGSTFCHGTIFAQKQSLYQ